MTDHTCIEKIGGDSIYFCGHQSRAGNHYDIDHASSFHHHAWWFRVWATTNLILNDVMASQNCWRIAQKARRRHDERLKKSWLLGRHHWPPFASPSAIVHYLKRCHTKIAVTSFVTILMVLNLDIYSSSYELLKFHPIRRNVTKSCIRGCLVTK